MPEISDIGGPFAFSYIEPPPPPPPPVPQPVVLRDIKRQRATVGPQSGTSSLPSSLVQRLFGISAVPIHETEPDPRTHSETHYYNSTLNRLYVKIDTTPVPEWRSIGG